MKVALVNPPWDFEGSIYFGCREPHLPLELGACRVLLMAAGHEVLMIDGHLEGRSDAELAAVVAAFAPDMTVVTTAPSYLFWRCAQPELRVPRATLDAIGRSGGLTVAVGPHGSSTPGPALRKLGCDAVVRGECEEAVAGPGEWRPPGRGARDCRARGRRPASWPAVRRARALPTCRRCTGRTAGCSGTTITTTASTAARKGRGPRWRRRAAAPTAAPSARRSISATSIADATCAAAGRDRRAGRPGRHLPVLHRRDLPAAGGPAGGAGVAPRPVRHPDPDRPVEARDAGAAGPGGLRVDRGGGGKPDRGWPRRAGQAVQDDHRRAGRPADPGPPARAVRAGQPDRDGRRRGRPGHVVARTAAGCRRVGQRPGAALPLSQLPRLPPAVGRAGRRGVGACAPSLPGPVHPLQRHPGEAGAARGAARPGSRMLR